MWDVLSALLPPAVVATVFCTFIYRLLRKEMAPRTSDGRLVGSPGTASSTEPAAADSVAPVDTDAVTAEGGAKDGQDSTPEVTGAERGSTDR
ncbi:hypothetical protein ACQEU5_06430 [Marinactinospora thermotolerans]|uniref:Uncharacterized protein n=1 Tax=Marinactinospora thermotolerans DSM 45154 TaxID=1122192 RepID=A0A1T4STF0_9ACTN|nr:hypothetical protein [Marinactinospora thermotolerans]SKA31171.1 hypothetical protein SAMN02745673_03901 [Marinactinospora thermotolerans DSM 45154]